MSHAATTIAAAAIRRDDGDDRLNRKLRLVDGATLRDGLNEITDDGPRAAA
ncbi:MAG: hypothetical protein ABJA82_10055 [Myxococcales bacterium]